MTTRAQLAARDREMIPKVLLQAMLALAIASLLLVAYARITDRPLEGVPVMRPVVAERLLTFVHAEDGRISVIEDGVELVSMTGRSAGFIDAFTAALERRRMVSDIDPMAPVRVAAFEDGHVVLIDPETGWRVDPRSFGREAQAVFAAYLEGR